MALTISTHSLAVGGGALLEDLGVLVADEEQREVGIAQHHCREGGGRDSGAV